jgi:feruloyl-CoA synthase
MRFVDDADPRRGLIFDGRLAEDFKLSTGTWVSVGPLRSRILAAAAGLAQDVVIGAPDREYVTALIFPNLAMCRTLARLDAAASARDVLTHPAIRTAFCQALERLAAESTGSSTFVARAVLLEQPPSPDLREITDKGSLNQKAVLANRAALVDELYGDAKSPLIIKARS